MNSLLRILSISLILLGTASASTVTQIQEDADKFISGVTLAKNCLRKLQASIELLKNASTADTQGQPISSDILTRDFNVYTTISNLCDDFSTPDSTQERRGEIFDHLGILTYAHLRIPNTIIDQETKQTIFENLGSKRSDAADFFMQCLLHDQSTNQFSLNLLPHNNKITHAYVTFAKEILPLISQKLISKGDELCTDYVQMDLQLANFGSQIDSYRWEINASNSSLATFIEQYNLLHPILLAITPIYKININAKKALDSYKSMKNILTKRFLDVFNETIETITKSDETKISDLTNEKMIKLASSRVALYEKAMKKLKKNQTDFSPNDEMYSFYIKIFKEYIEFYKELQRQINFMRLACSENEKKAIADKLFIQCSVHLTRTKNAGLTEEFYIQPMINLLKQDISSEATIFTEILIARKEDNNIRYDIEFSDALYKRWIQKRDRFTSLPDAQLLMNAEGIAQAIIDLTETYKQLTTSFKSLIADNQPPHALFETLKPLLTQYKKNVAKKVNEFETLLNKEIPSTKKKKKSRKKRADNKVEKEDTLLQTVNSSSIMDERAEQQKLADITEQQKLADIAEQQRLAKLTKQKRENEQKKPKELTEEEKAARLLRKEFEKERKERIRRNIAHQQKIEREREDAELAKLVEQRKLIELARMEKQAINSRPATSGNQTSLIIQEKTDHNTHNDSSLSSTSNGTSLSDTPLSPKPSVFKLNVNAVEFKPTAIPNEAQQLVTTATAYDPDYVAWLAAQQAWQQYYAAYGYYGHPIYG